MNKIAANLVNIIGNTNPEFSELQLKKMEYGLLCFFNEITKLILYFIIFYIFDSQDYYLVALLFFCSLRAFTGGYHANTYWGCFFVSLLIFCAIVIIGKNVVLGINVIAILLFMSLISVSIFSPVDNINKRIKSNERRLKLKYLSIIITIFLWVLSYVISNKFFATGVISILAASLMMMLGAVNNKFQN